MNLLKTTLASAAVAGAGLFAVPDTADAQVRFYSNNGNYGVTYGNGAYGSGHRGYDHYRGGGYGYGRNDRTWHDTSHYDYHPTTVTRHRNHYHVQPGHYDYHQSGHWDRGYGGRGGYGGHGHNH